MSTKELVETPMVRGEYGLLKREKVYQKDASI